MDTPTGLSSLYWTVLHLVDVGQSATIEETYAHIDAGDTIEWLTRLAGSWEVQTGFLALIRGDVESMANVRDFLERYRNAVSPSEVSVTDNGLCLLLGYSLSELQSALS